MSTRDHDSTVRTVFFDPAHSNFRRPFLVRKEVWKLLFIILVSISQLLSRWTRQTDMSEVVQGLNDVREQATQALKLARDVLPPCEEADEVRQDGVSLLQVKYATLMRYNLNLAKLALARVRGESITSLASKLVEDSVALSKLRPIERKLQHHIELLLKGGRQKSSTGDNSDVDDVAQLRPNPSDIVLDEDENEDNITAGDRKERENSDNEKDGGVYRPPRLAEVVYDATAERKRERKKKEQDRFRDRALRSEGIREMVAEVKGLPEEVGMDGFGDASKSSRQVLQVRKEDDSRKRFEESNFTRVNLSGKDKKRRRDVMRAVEKPGVGDSNEFTGLALMADRVMGSKVKKARGRDQGGEDEDDEESRLRKLDDALQS